MANSQYVYVMKGLTKAYPGGREVLKDVWLSFLPGAKIGVLGPNGAGKSTLMKIMAGVDKEFNGEAWAADGVRVGYLAQEPELDPSLDVLGNVMMVSKRFVVSFWGNALSPCRPGRRRAFVASKAPSCQCVRPQDRRASIPQVAGRNTWQAWWRRDRAGGPTRAESSACWPAFASSRSTIPC